MLSQAAANASLDLTYGDGSPATLYFALFTASPSPDGTGGTEVTGGSYARKAVTNNATEFPAASGGVKSNANPIAWATATANWGIVTDLVVTDALSAGNRYDFGPLTAARTVNNGDTFSIAATQFEVTYP